MPSLPFIPDSAPFSSEQRAWLNGFLAGMLSRSPGSVVPSPAPVPAASPLTPLTILFGSQTGTGEALAKRTAKAAGQRGFAATVMDLATLDLAKLGTEKNVLVITSTYGDGEPPDNARALHTALAAAIAATPPSDGSRPLRAVRYSVCALGDTNYIQFCKCGQDFDAWLEKLGALRVAPRAECDLDYEQTYSAWLDAALLALPAGSPAATAASAPSGQTASALPASIKLEDTGYSRNRPFPALVRMSHPLNAPGSAKQVQHLAFELGDSGLVYEAGDALGVYPHNCPALVSDVLALLGCDGEEAVPAPDGRTTSLRHALTECYDLGKPPAALISLLSRENGDTSQPAPAPAAESGAAGIFARPVAAPHHVIDLLATGRARVTPTQFVQALKKIQPRLYSISSSPRAHAGCVHLTVGAVRYELDGRARQGVCSTFLADRSVPGQTRAGVFIHSNPAFRPPANGTTAMIMVGPGTGIAPFRAFLHDRKAAGATGHNWLFFGDQRAATDFLYRDELTDLLREGVLTRLDTAFSRDQAEKIYVQHRMLEHAAELYAWLEAGAHFYVCGDAARMAKDVDVALHTLIERAGQKSPDEAAAYVQSLRSTKRYARDVY